MPLLNELAAFNADGDLQVVVESPRGAAIKLKYEPRLGAFSVARALPVGLTYPFDWGFVPGTLGPDQDPIHALVVQDMGTFPGIRLPCKLLRGVKVSQRSFEGGPHLNNRI